MSLVGTRTRWRSPCVLFGTAAVALLLGAGALSAQPIASAFVRPGDRVRVTTYEMAMAGERHSGTLQRVARDSITVDWSSGVRETVPLHRVRRLEVSDGRGSFVAQGTGFGLLGGVVGGAVYGLASTDRSDELGAHLGLRF